MKSTRLGVALTAAAIAATALSGCTKVAEIRNAAADTAAQVVASGTEQIVHSVSGDLFTAEGIDGAMSAISEKVGANPMQVVEVTVVPGVLTVQAIDPAAPTELNQWSYTAGAVGASRPVDYDDDTEALRQNLFGTDEVPSAAIVTAVGNAVTASEIPGAEVQSLTIKRNLPFGEDITIFLNVEGERSSKQVRTDASGQVVDVV
ncbi:ABC-type glycerol-3-phosphate transport system substrate-binding protein [Mycolicibacterium iranicum]|uniref:ABC-type glycerol-3-phosphate transport system substrate-binding protein n=1 Tax=Mycolicibacterium iranicum TaxID=912594 RepID=A0A839PYP2_MYCIR|nr:hypothetical protein [Mycolicibacterium iranicum]MBB2989130.1 ABC-type glycerol-3-phosphate transport system substrate-binding protein [Mycolicibacterium iranicum]